MIFRVYKHLFTNSEGDTFWSNPPRGHLQIVNIGGAVSKTFRRGLDWVAMELEHRHALREKKEEEEM